MHSPNHKTLRNVRPDDLLAHLQEEEKRQNRGRLKIFMGYAAGVGKTYAMLEAAHQRLVQGIAYRGPAVLFSRNYMTSYEPIRDEAGQVIGVLYVGLDISQSMTHLCVVDSKGKRMW